MIIITRLKLREWKHSQALILFYFKVLGNLNNTILQGHFPPPFPQKKTQKPFLTETMEGSDIFISVWLRISVLFISVSRRYLSSVR